MDAFKTLSQRGFIYQTTDDDGLPDRLAGDAMSFYLGIDPTADSMHIGHLLPLMAARWLQRFGHKPILLVGGGTAMIGDPSGKTDMRQMLDRAELQHNAARISSQIARFIHCDDAVVGDGPAAAIVDNAEWLIDLNYIAFLRDIGCHFSVNRMLAAESVKLRLDTGLSFLEFNYMLLQAYDFYVLARDRGCSLQLGGQDQWGNIVAGIDLTRRLLGRSVYGITVPLLTDRQGRKFGKTVDGAVWLEADKTSIFDYYQFWRNVEDDDVKKLLFLFTTLPADEIERLGALVDPEINRAKEILAYEATALAHGAAAAARTYLAAAGRFGFADPESRIETTSAIVAITPAQVAADLPTVTLSHSDLGDGIWIARLLVLAGLGNSNGAARRLISGGGAYLNDQRITDVDLEVGPSDFVDGALLLRAGKKNIRRVVLA